VSTPGSGAPHARRSCPQQTEPATSRAAPAPASEGQAAGGACHSGGQNCRNVSICHFYVSGFQLSRARSLCLQRSELSRQPRRSQANSLAREIVFPRSCVNRVLFCPHSTMKSRSNDRGNVLLLRCRQKEKKRWGGEGLTSAPAWPWPCPDRGDQMTGRDARACTR
jgi:hypothetical protein